MTGLTVSSNASPVAIFDEKRRDRTMILLVENLTKGNSDPTNQHSCVVSRALKFPLISQTMVQVKIFCRGIQLVKSHANLVLKRVALVAQGIVNTVPGEPFLIKIAHLSLSCTLILKKLEVASCVAPPQPRFGSKPVGYGPGTLSVVHIYIFLQSKKKILY